MPSAWSVVDIGVLQFLAYHYPSLSRDDFLPGGRENFIEILRMFLYLYKLKKCYTFL